VNEAQKEGIAMNSLMQDLRYGARMLMKHPGFTLIAVLTLALGIGANTAIFSFVNALLLRPPGGVAEPERLVQIGRQSVTRGGFSDSSYPDYLDYREQNTTLSGLALRAAGKAFHLSTGQEAERVDGELVSGNFFDVLGVKPALGRLIAPADAQVEGASPVAVISYRLWQRRFGGDPRIVGESIQLNARSYVVIGVADEQFNGIKIGEPVDIWVPITMWREADPIMASYKVDFLRHRGAQWLELLGRLKPGVTLEQARAEFAVIGERLAQAHPQIYTNIRARLEPGLGVDPESRAEMRSFTTIPFAAVGVVLLIACANVAGLLLARNDGRRREISVRLALGASRPRIVRQLLIEGLMLALAGGALGLLFSTWLTAGVHRLLPDSYRFMSFKLDLGMDWRIFSFSLSIAVVTGLLCALLPALRASKQDLTSALKDGRLAGARGGRVGVRSALVVTQVALSLVLLVAAGLCVRTLRNARAIDTGYEVDRVLTARLNLGRQNYDQARGQNFYQQLIDRTRALPGVSAVSLARNLPLNDSYYGTRIFPEGGDGRGVQINFNYISPRYLETLNIPLRLGRDFFERDNERSPGVAIINETLARSVWPNQNPVGKRFTWVRPDGSKPVTEVIGVTRDTKGRNLFEPTGVFMYLPLMQNYQQEAILHLRTTIEPERLAAAVQREVSALDRNLPLYDIKPLRDHLTATLTPQRLLALLISGFGLLALLLASVGLYGVLAYTVTQRTPELGIRLALGAQRRDVLRLIVAQGVKLALIGVSLGLIASFALTRLLKNLLFGVSATDPLTFIITTLLLIMVALLAALVPARRATKVDPMIALRYE
jgi:putative ABC transport system permease protein